MASSKTMGKPAAGLLGGPKPFQLLMGRYGTPRFLYGHAFRLKPAQPTTDATKAALNIAQDNRDLFGLGNLDVLKLHGTTTHTKRSWVRFRQYHRGVPVLGGGLALGLDGNNEVYSVHNSIVPDIQRSQVPAVGAQAATVGLAAKHAGFALETSELFYRPQERFCDTAVLAWRLRYKSGGEPRIAWVDAHDGKTIEDVSRKVSVGTPNVGVYQQTDGTSSIGTALKACSAISCPGGLGTAADEACEGMSDLWDYWEDPLLHGDLATKSYDGRGACLAANIANCTTAPPASTHNNDEIPYVYAWACTNYHTKGVFAHEYGHTLISNNAIEVPITQNRPVYEHIADMQAYAIDSQDKITRSTGCTIRDWANPASVTTTCSGETVHFPVTFDDRNQHSWVSDTSTQGRPNHYIKWHVPSTMWSHMVYRLAQKPGFDRKKASSVVFHALREGGLLDHDDDFVELPYQWNLLEASDLKGHPYNVYMRQVQKEVGLWGFAEQVIPYCVNRPALTFLWNASWHHLVVYYIKFDRSGPTNRIMELIHDFDTGLWWESDTRLSLASTSDSGFTAGYAYDFFVGRVYLAWRGWDSKIYYTSKPGPSGAWDPIQSISDVYSTHQPVIAVGGRNGDEVRLFYRDSSTGTVKYVVRTETSWTTPVAIPGVGSVKREPAPTWDPDAGRYVVVYVEGDGPEGEARYVEIEPLPEGDVFGSPVLLRDCAYATGPHKWDGQISAAIGARPAAAPPGPRRLYLLGKRNGEVSQAAMDREAGVWKLWHHSPLSRLADGVVVRSGAPGLYAVIWNEGQVAGNASIIAK